MRIRPSAREAQLPLPEARRRVCELVQYARSRACKFGMSRKSPCVKCLPTRCVAIWHRNNPYQHMVTSLATKTTTQRAYCMLPVCGRRAQMECRLRVCTECDCKHRPQPVPDGAKRAMSVICRHAGVFRPARGVVCRSQGVDNADGCEL